MISCSGRRSFCKLLSHVIGAGGIRVIISRKKIWKEQELYYNKEDEEFQQNYHPQCFPDSHFPEAVTIENPYFF